MAMTALHLNDEQCSLVEANINLVYGAIKKYGAKDKLRHLAFDDIVQIGSYALCKAALKYDSKRSRFSTYAYQVIANSFNDELRRSNRHGSVELVCFGSDLEVEAVECFGSDFIMSLDLAAAIDKLKQRSCVAVCGGIDAMLMEMSGAKRAEIAKKCGVSVSCIKYRIAQARSAIIDDDEFLRDAGLDKCKGLAG